MKFFGYCAHTPLPLPKRVAEQLLSEWNDSTSIEVPGRFGEDLRTGNHAARAPPVADHSGRYMRATVAQKGCGRTRKTRAVSNDMALFTLSWGVLRNTFELSCNPLDSNWTTVSLSRGRLRKEHTMSLIPGASAIGRGFNILGTYSTRSLMPQQIVNLGPDARNWEYPPSGITYQVPENATPIEYTNTMGSSYVYNTVSQFQSHFSQKAEVQASYGAFSAQFNAAYSKTVNTDQSYYYGIYEADFTAWELNLNHTSTQWLSADFRDDPDIKNLPSTFNSANQEQFFAVFRKWGTHFVGQVVVGGSLDYYEAVQTMYTSNQSQVSANIELEYKAVFTSSKAESHTQWEELTKTWSDSRLVTVNATGGDASALNALTPGYGDSKVGVFDAWSAALMKNPSVIDFNLRPLNMLFSGNQATAVAQALEAYTNGAILTYAATDYTPHRAPGGGNVSTSWGIITNGRVATPVPEVDPPAPTVIAPGEVAPVGGYQLALYDSTTFEPLMVHLYYQTYQPNSLTPDPAIYKAMMKDLNGVKSTGYIAAVTGFGIDLLNYPSQDFQHWLLSIGATMQGWKKFVGYPDKGGSACYTVVGRQGSAPGLALEILQAVYSPNTWLAEPYYFNMNASVVGLTYARSATAATKNHAIGSVAKSLEPEQPHKPQQPTKPHKPEDHGSHHHK
ncbi:MAC/perforin domain-containing protein [Nocardia sp. NPDC056100]|uniref:MAC/perforin domain-containing protein n=1 Tax=Nocardia sp. NPDC056100 TaxID=3345712 RepID=UPI0035DA3221